MYRFNLQRSSPHLNYQQVHHIIFSGLPVLSSQRGIQSPPTGISFLKLCYLLVGGG